MNSKSELDLIQFGPYDVDDKLEKVEHKEGNFYRFSNACGKVILDVFKTYRKTDKGTWIHPEFTRLHPWCEDKSEKYKLKFLDAKFVLDDSRKKYAYPNIKDAVNSFRIRLHRRIGYLNRDLELAKEALEFLMKNSEEMKQGYSQSY